MTLQDVIVHLAACAASMNRSGEYSLAMRTQAAIEAVAAVQSGCVEYGMTDEEHDRGDWQIDQQESQL